jgi:hypothetical protein
MRPLAERDPSTPRGALDDDPAILDNNAEEWIQDSGGIPPRPISDLAAGMHSLTTRVAGPSAEQAPTHPALIHWLCSYRC